MPIVSGLEGINLFSLNVGGRYTSYYNKGGAGTTGAAATQNVFNWKFQTVLRAVRVGASAHDPFARPACGRLPRSVHPAAGPAGPVLGQNPWRDYNPESTEGRQERWGQTRVGNPRLNPEKSDTLTMGMVLSPGGWAQGMRLPLDYFSIRIKDAITTPFIEQHDFFHHSLLGGSGNRDGAVDDPDTDDDQWTDRLGLLRSGSAGLSVPGDHVREER